jgi:Ca2+-binding EF-hand superfamily protein
VLDHNIRVRDKYLRNFCYLFRTVDKDSNGIISEDEFVLLLSKMNVFDSKTFAENANRLLNAIDPFNNKQIIFSDCVNLFCEEVPNQENSEKVDSVKYNLLDFVAMNKEILSN